MESAARPPDRRPPEVRGHYEFLDEAVFQTATRWPHFERLLEDLTEIADGVGDRERVVELERAFIYGGDSLFGPLFHRGSLTVVDIQIDTAAERGGYKRSMMDDPRALRVPASHKAWAADTGLPDGHADVLVVPNIVHHVRDQDAMFREFARLLAPGGRGYVFEALLRELHQSPDDFLRYTPWGIRDALARHGLELTEWRPTGGPFEAITYCWSQALEYLPPDIRAERERWFYSEQFPELIALDRQYHENLAREHTSFPVAFGAFFTKPERH